MQGFTIADLQARHDRLVQDRKQNQEQIELLQEREHGYKYVLGELEQMIQQLTEREAATNAAAAAVDIADFAALAEGSAE
jgi:hypothetical protein